MPKGKAAMPKGMPHKPMMPKKGMPKEMPEKMMPYKGKGGKKK